MWWWNWFAFFFVFSLLSPGSLWFSPGSSSLKNEKMKKWNNSKQAYMYGIMYCGKLTRAYTKKFEEELWTQPWKFEIYETAIIHHRLAMSWDHEIISFITVMQADTLLPRISYEELYDAFIENILNFVVILHL